jgi:hypothetical protein
MDPHILMKALMKEDKMNDEDKLKFLRRAIIKIDLNE